MRKTILAAALFAAIVAPGCGGDDEGAGGGLATVAIGSDALDHGALAAPRDAEVTVRMDAKDGNGSPVSADATSWAASGDGIEVRASGATATVVMHRDWFDAAGREPEATLTATLDGKTATVTVRGVINASGTWSAKLGSGLAYPLDLSQVGRTVTDRSTRYSGTITGNTLAIDVSGFAIRGTFLSRDEAKGTYSGSGTSGPLTCTRQ